MKFPVGSAVDALGESRDDAASQDTIYSLELVAITECGALGASYAQKSAWMANAATLPLNEENSRRGAM